MRTTYIVSAPQIRHFQQELIKEHGVLIGTQVLPFEAACIDSQPQTEILCYEALQQHSFSLLGVSFTSPSLIQSMISFHIEMQCYGLGLDALPQKTQREQELYHAFTILEPFMPKLKVPQGKIVYQPDGLSLAQISYLKRIKASPLEETTLTPTHIEAYEALNFRQELEGTLQYILKNDIHEATLAVFDFDHTAPYIESCFKRYGLDLTLQNRSFEVIKHQLLAFIDYASHKDLKTLLALIASGGLGLKRPFKLIQYIQHYKLQCTDMTLPFDYAKPSSDYLVQDIIELQNLIQDDVHQLQTFLEETAHMSLSDFIIHALNRLVAIHDYKAQPLMQYLQSIFPWISKHSLPVIIHQIKKLKDKPKRSLSINVVDVNALAHNPDNPLFILGITSKVYPNLAVRSGVIDERYLSSIEGFPNIETRNHFNLQAKRSMFHKSKTLILSFPHATYDGKSLEAAYDAEVFLQERGIPLKTWEIHESLLGVKQETKLNKSLAALLYAPQGKINASVSSFELYVEDPVQYFIRYGLRLQEPPHYALDARLFGTLNHSFFEKALTGSNTNLWDIYEPYLPHNDALLTLIRELNDDIMHFHLDQINQSIKHTDFKPYQFEVHFETDALFKDINLRGIIDRIDLAHDNLLIVDYKSSNHSLKMSSITEGYQLQLLTYALVARLLLNKQVQGVFYYSLNHNALASSCYDYKKTKGIVPPKTPNQDDVIKAHGYKGWFFEEPHTYFNSDVYHSGLKYREKDDTYTIYGGLYDIEHIKEHFSELFAYIQTQILDGVLDNSAFDLPLYQDISFKKGDANNDDNL